MGRLSATTASDTKRKTKDHSGKYNKVSSKKSQSMKDNFGNAFAFDRVATEPRFNALKPTATPSVGYYSPVYTLTLPTLTGGILPKSGITEKYVPKSLVKQRNSEDILDQDKRSKKQKTLKPKFSRLTSAFEPNKGYKFSKRLRMASHPEYLEAQLHGADKVFIPGISDTPGSTSYTPINSKATFQMKANEQMSQSGNLTFGKRKKKKSIDYSKSTGALATMAKMGGSAGGGDTRDNAFFNNETNRLKLAIELANNRQRSKAFGGGTRTNWNEREYDLHKDSILQRIRKHENSLNQAANCPPNTGRYIRDELKEQAIADALEPYFHEGRKEVKNIGNYVYKFQPQFQVYKRELSKHMQQEMFEEKRRRKAQALNEVLHSLGDGKHDSPVLFGRERVMSVFYKSWMGLESSEPEYEPMQERYKYYQKKKIREELMKKGKKSKSALKKLKRLDMDEESSGDEEDDNDLTLTHIPKIDMSNPFKYQYERMKKREGLGDHNGYLYNKEKQKHYYPSAD
eukprot:g1210.t1